MFINDCCCRKAIRFTYFCVREYVRVGTRALACACARVALPIQHATRRLIAICGLSDSTTFFDIISEMARLEKKVTEHKMCILTSVILFEF